MTFFYLSINIHHYLLNRTYPNTLCTETNYYLSRLIKNGNFIL